MKKYVDTPNKMSRTMTNPQGKERGGTEEGCTRDLNSVSNFIIWWWIISIFWYFMPFCICLI